MKNSLKIDSAEKRFERYIEDELNNALIRAFILKRDEPSTIYLDIHNANELELSFAERFVREINLTENFNTFNYELITNGELHTFKIYISLEFKNAMADWFKHVGMEKAMAFRRRVIARFE